MKLYKNSKRITAIVLILVFMVSFARPAAVFAEDGTPVEPAPQVEPTQTPADEDPAPVTPPEEVPPLPDVLQGLPEDTGIIVIGDDGQVEPLASQSAADAILANDPMWCPAGALDGSDCYNALTITALISSMLPQSGAGTLYFMSAYNGDDLFFDHTNPILSNLTDVTIQGGWDGVTTGTPSFSGPTTLNHSLEIRNWIGNLTINNINVQTGDPAMDGIVIADHTGNVTLNESSASDNDFGLFLNEVTGDITINNSEFSENANKGFEGFYLHGSLTVTGSSFDGNDRQGVHLVDVEDVTITNSTLNDNGLEGLRVNFGQDIVLANVHVNGNNTSGGWENYIGDVSSVNISGSQFNENSNHGFGLGTVNGMMSIDNSQFNNNEEWGMVLFETQAEITITCSSFNNNQEGEINGDGVVTFIGCKKTSTEPGQADGLIVPVLGGESIPLDCGYSWTMLELPAGDRAKFAGFCGSDSQLIPVQQNGLPGALPDGLSFSSSFTANSLKNGAVQQTLPEGGSVNLSFAIPPELEGKELVILFWDAAAGIWVEIPLTGDEGAFSASNSGMLILKGLNISAGGYASATVNFTGTFVLATR